jgi:transcription elongation factor Elf1
MQRAAANRRSAQTTPDPDIFFHCEHCNTALVVNRAAAGMTLNCQRCGKPTAVPTPEGPDAAATAQLQQIHRRLKENESQRTEVTGHINQLSIQLHRWQLRMQMLNERKQQLEKELMSLKS